METKFLFPHRYKKAGWFLFLSGILSGILWLAFFSDSDFLNVKVFAFMCQPEFFSSGTKFFMVTENSILDEIAAVLIIVGGLLVAFSRVKTEDEYISRIRLESLVWAVFVNYGVLLLAVLFIYDLPFLQVMIYNMFTFLFFFILRFHWVLSRSKKVLRNEKLS